MAHDRGLYAWLLSGVTLALVFSPVCRPADVDSFPFSGYAMFAYGRPTAITDVHHMLAFDVAGDKRPVPPHLVANDEVLQADVILRRASQGGRTTSRALCDQVAARLAGDPAWADVVTLELRGERFDAVRYFAGDTAPIKSRLRARCAVARP